MLPTDGCPCGSGESFGRRCLPLPRDGRRSATLHERSRFAVRARRWLYVDGDVDVAGAVIGFWQPGTHPGFTEWGQHGTPYWFECQSKD
ncbi:hypothetical protein MSAR_32670 [Mycolicibacterium sarraceniae]|uniref:Uncharacterized protein n=1 Tax=Mycolicibacterium sarraceniae TaxID=1534348 RepID=A0A7I7SUZ8_9MYCO|nr:hypothetical protein MSAR_32670 [Mycolicibacterium sarraceniae]